MLDDIKRAAYDGKVREMQGGTSRRGPPARRCWLCDEEQIRDDDGRRIGREPQVRQIIYCTRCANDLERALPDKPHSDLLADIDGSGGPYA